jgi:hypothetical protein
MNEQLFMPKPLVQQALQAINLITFQTSALYAHPALATIAAFTLEQRQITA